MPQIKLKYASFIENEINKCVYGIYLFFGGEEEIRTLDLPGMNRML